MARRTVTVGSTRHTWILIAILLGIALAGFLTLQLARPNGAHPPAAGASLYLGLIAAEWGLLLYVRAGVKKHGGSLADLISDRQPTLRTFAADIVLGLLLLAVLVGAGILFAKALGHGNAALVQRLLVTRTELVPLWILLALSAGFVEEVTYRGYLQRQFGAWLRHPWWGVAAQAALFGVSHGYQGGILIARIALLGLLFGAAAYLRRSLVPGMVAHAGLDIIGGLQALR